MGNWTVTRVPNLLSGLFFAWGRCNTHWLCICFWFFWLWPAGSVQLSGKRQAGPQFCRFSFTPVWKMPLPHSENRNKDSELGGARSIFGAPAPSTGVVTPVLAPWGYNLLLEKEQFLWKKLIFQEIITLYTYKAGVLVLKSLLASASNNLSILSHSSLAQLSAMLDGIQSTYHTPEY